MCGHLREGQAWVEQVLAAAPARSPEWAQVLYAAVTLAVRLRDLARANTSSEELLAIGRDLDDPDLINLGLTGLGMVAIIQRDSERAAPLLEEALVLARASGNQEQIALSLINVGVNSARQGDLERATALTEESLPICGELGNPQWTIYALVNLGQLALAQAAWADAATLLKEGLQLAGTLGMQDGILAEAFTGLGIVAGAGGDHEQAARLFGAADALLAMLGTSLDPVLPEAFARAVAATPDALGEEVYAAHHATGAALPFEEAVAEALAISGT